MSVLNDPGVRDSLRFAWLESRPRTEDAHEEGGFVLRNVDGSIIVQRWPRGEKDQILVPSHVGGMRGSSLILATFHTHPNIGQPYLQEPSMTDIRAVRDDPNLAHPEFEGEYVIGVDKVYVVRKNGQVDLFGETKVVLNMTESKNA